ncbi:protein phosphatase 2C domain-containing protein [Actinoplanes sp. NPDC023936]|uniref:PP2C family protein-serine/threonine phosphatase n=1 Tax=Actinoplanes sp. NPDC023936 TaxID=3154910 RepID=UPI0033FF50D6
MSEHGLPAATAMSAAGPGRAPAGRANIDYVVITAATAGGGHRPNDDAIGVNGWVLTAEDVNPLDLTVPVVDHRAAVVSLTDGLAGAAGGDVAAAVAARRLTARQTQRSATAEAFREAFRQADELVHEASTDDLPGIGCSAAAVLIRADGRAFVGNVGDVRLYQILNGYIGRLTRDDRARTEEGPSGADRVVTRCLGGRLRIPVEVHFTEIPVLPGDRLLLCSDGLYDTVSDSEIEQALKAQRPGHAIAGLVKAAKSRGGGNITVVLLEPRGRSVRGPAPVLTPQPSPQPSPEPPPQPELASAEKTSFLKKLLRG